MDKKVTKSDRIRQLWDAGMEVKDICRLLGIRYQFAYNVVSYYVKEKEVKEVYALVGAAHADGNHLLHAEGHTQE